MDLEVDCAQAFTLHIANPEVKHLGLGPAIDRVKDARGKIQAVINTCLGWDLEDPDLESKQVDVSRLSTQFTQACEFVNDLYHNLLDLEDMDAEDCRKGKRSSRFVVKKLTTRYSLSGPVHLATFLAEMISKNGERQCISCPYGAELTTAVLGSGTDVAPFLRPRCIGCTAADSEVTPFHDLMKKLLTDVKNDVDQWKAGLQDAVSASTSGVAHGMTPLARTSFQDSDAFKKVCLPLSAGGSLM